MSKSPTTLPRTRARAPASQQPRINNPAPTTTNSHQPTQPQPQIPPPLTRAEVYARLRPWGKTAAVVAVVVSGTLGGAFLKTEWQNRRARNTFAEEEAAKLKASLAGSGVGDANGTLDGVVDAAQRMGKETGAAAGSGGGFLTPSQQNQQKKIEKEANKVEEQKSILYELHALESRRNDLLRMRDALTGKVEKLQERMKKREEDERLRREREEGLGEGITTIKVKR